MNARYLLFIFIFVINTGFSQNKKLDSLLTILNNYSKKDTVRINKLIDVANFHYLREIEKAIPYLKEALSIAKLVDDIDKVVYLKAKIAKNYNTRGLQNEALEQILKASKILDNANATADKKIDVLSQLSVIYRATGNYKKSLETSLEVLKLSKELPLTTKTARYHYNLGQIYTALKQYDKVENHYREAINVAKQLKSKQIEVVINSALADYYRDIGKYEQAKKTIKKWMPFYKKNKQDRNLASAYRTIATTETLQGNYKASIPFFEKALEIYNKTGNLHYSKITYQNLFINYSILRDKDKAIKANKNYEKLEDSLNSKARKNLIAKMETTYKTNKIAREKELLEKTIKINELESQKQRFRFWFAVAVALLTLLLSLFYFKKVKAKKETELTLLKLKETEKKLELEKKYRFSELKALKSQMNPHFIFNALNSIQDYIVQNQKNLAGDYLGKFADLIRLYLEQSSLKEISLFDEIDTLKRYLELEKVRFEDKLEYKIDIDKNLPIENIYIPTMLIQPYIENALKHGILHKKGTGNLSVSFTSNKDEALLICKIIDDGIGRKKSEEIYQKRTIKHTSFATKANENRLKLLNFNKERKISISIEDMENSKTEENTGTKVTIQIPI